VTLSNAELIATFALRPRGEEKPPILMSTCKTVLQNHVVFSVLLDGIGSFEVVVPVFVVAAAMQPKGGDVRDFNLSMGDAIAYALVHRASMPMPVQDYLARLAGDERRLEAMRVSAFHYLWEVYRGQ